MSYLVKLHYFEIGPLLNSDGTRLSNEVNEITAITDSIAQELIEKFRNYILDNSEVGVNKTPYTDQGQFTFLSPQPSYFLLMWVRQGNIFDSLGNAYPIIRRCYILTENDRQSLSGFVTPLIEFILQSPDDLKVRESLTTNLKPLVYPVDTDRGLARQIIDSVQQNLLLEQDTGYSLGDNLLKLFHSLSSVGKAQISAKDADLSFRLSMLNALLAILTTELRSRILFSTSTTKPQHFGVVHIAFVDHGSLQSDLKVDFTEERNIQSSQAGMYYMKYLYQQLYGENAASDFSIADFLEQIRLPEDQSRWEYQFGNWLDISVRFLQVRKDYHYLSFDKPFSFKTAPSLSEVHLSIVDHIDNHLQTYEEILTESEIAELNARQIVYLLEILRKNPETVKVIQNIIARIVASTLPIDRQNELFDALKRTVIIIDDVEIADQLTNHLVPFDDINLEDRKRNLLHFLHEKWAHADQDDKIIDLWFRNNAQNAPLNIASPLEILTEKRHVHRLVVKVVTSTNTYVNHLINQIMVTLVQIHEFEQAYPNTYSLIIHYPHFEQFSSKQDIVSRSVVEFDGAESWLRWCVENVPISSHPYLINPATFQCVSMFEDFGIKDILQKWLTSWDERPHILTSIVHDRELLNKIFLHVCEHLSHYGVAITTACLLQNNAETGERVYVHHVLQEFSHLQAEIDEYIKLHLIQDEPFKHGMRQYLLATSIRAPEYFQEFFAMSSIIDSVSKLNDLCVLLFHADLDLIEDHFTNQINEMCVFILKNLPDFDTTQYKRVWSRTDKQFHSYYSNLWQENIAHEFNQLNRQSQHEIVNYLTTLSMTHEATLARAKIRQNDVDAVIYKIQDILRSATSSTKDRAHLLFANMKNQLHNRIDISSNDSQSEEQDG